MRHTFRPAWPYLWRYRRALLLGLLAILLMELVAVGLPLLIRSGVDALTRGGSLRTHVPHDVVALADGAAVLHESRIDFECVGSVVIFRRGRIVPVQGAA